MSRVEILQRSLKPPDAKVVTTLATLAREQLNAGNNQHAAGLLRGAEQLSIAALAYQVSAHIRHDLRRDGCLQPSTKTHLEPSGFLSPGEAIKESRWFEAVLHIHIAVG